MSSAPETNLDGAPPATDNETPQPTGTPDAEAKATGGVATVPATSEEQLAQAESGTPPAQASSSTSSPAWSMFSFQTPPAPEAAPPAAAVAEAAAAAPSTEASASVSASAAGPGFFGSILTSVNNTFTDLSSQATNAVGDLQNTVVNLGTHATKLSTSLQAAEEQWREFFPIKAKESGEEERLLSFFFCNLLTSIGPCAGTLFVSDLALYFVSDQELEFEVQEEETDESQYRVSIPLNCVKGMAPRISPKNETERFIHVVTADGFDFWFTGFLNYDSAFAHLLAALHDVGRKTDSLLRDEES